MRGTLVALGEAQHLAAERGQAAVVAVELLDQIFDLAAVELDAFDLGGQLLAQLLVLLLLGGGEGLEGRERVHAGAWTLLNFLKIAVISANFSSAWGLSVSSIWASDKGVVLVLFLGLRLGAPLDHVLVVFVGVGLGLVGDLFLFLDGRAGGLLADLALGAFGPFFAGGDLLGGRALGEHRLEVEDFAQLHAPFVQGVGPADDGVEGDRAFAQAPDHDVAAGLDPLGDGDLALAAEELDRAHFAQVHADRVVGAVGRFLLGRRGGAGAAVVERVDLVLGCCSFSLSSSSSSSPPSAL